MQHALHQPAVLELQRGAGTGNGLRVIAARPGVHGAHGELPGLRFGAAHEGEITAAAQANRPLRQTDAAPRAALHAHTSR